VNRPQLWADGKRTQAYVDSLVVQTIAWMEGVSLHNTYSNECCADFSCCRPDMAMPLEKRQAIGAKQLAEWTNAPEA
jgi:hypothetical protein